MQHFAATWTTIVFFPPHFRQTTLFSSTVVAQLTLFKPWNQVKKRFFTLLIHIDLMMSATFITMVK